MAIAALFGANAQEYQQISAQAAAYLAQFVAALTSGGGWYAAAETANATLAHEVLNAVNAPTQALLAGRWSATALTAGRASPVGRVDCCMAMAGTVGRVPPVRTVGPATVRD